MATGPGTLVDTTGERIENLDSFRLRAELLGLCLCL